MLGHWRGSLTWSSLFQLAFLALPQKTFILTGEKVYLVNSKKLFKGFFTYLTQR